MIYTIEEAEQGGWAITKKNFDCGAETLVAVADSTVGVADFFDPNRRFVKPSDPLKVAKELMGCFEEHQRCRRKINAIKLVRTATGCGLKEAKDAVEAAIHHHDLVNGHLIT